MVSIDDKMAYKAREFIEKFPRLKFVSIGTIFTWREHGSISIILIILLLSLFQLLPHLPIYMGAGMILFTAALYKVLDPIPDYDKPDTLKTKN